MSENDDVIIESPENMELKFGSIFPKFLVFFRIRNQINIIQPKQKSRSNQITIHFNSLPVFKVKKLASLKTKKCSTDIAVVEDVYFEKLKKKFF